MATPPDLRSYKALLKWAYGGIQAHIPPGLAQVASDVVFTLSKKPFVYRDRQHLGAVLERGCVTFSIDFEMAWAFRFSKTSQEDCISRGLRERKQVPRILDAFDEYGLPATWATVGHLFLNNCVRGVNGLAHPEMPRAGHFDYHWRFASGDWYQHDPCTSVLKDPAWYAPDLIEAILRSNTGHELACHSFSHIGFGPYCSDGVAAAELEACIEAMKRYSVRPKTIVFPGNQAGKFDVVAKKGFRSVRAFPVSWAEVTLPVKDEHGLWHVHTSTTLETAYKSENPNRRLARLRKYVDKAVETKLAAHLWFHPSLPEGEIATLLRPILRYCAELREKGVLDVFTMDELVSETESLSMRGAAKREHCSESRRIVHRPDRPL